MPVTLSGATNGARGSGSTGPSRASNNVNGQGANSDVSIAELIREGQWTVSWPTELILGADALAPRRARTPFVVKNAKTSIAELRSYISEPRPITVKRTLAGVPKTMKVTFLSAERVLEIAAALERVNGNPNEVIGVRL